MELGAYELQLWLCYEEGNQGGGQKTLSDVLGGCGGQSQEFSSAPSARKVSFAGPPGVVFVLGAGGSGSR